VEGWRRQLGFAAARVACAGRRVLELNNFPSLKHPFFCLQVNSTIAGLIQEVSDNNCVYRNEVHHTAGERTQVLQDVSSDPTLPRTKTVRCNVCGHGEAVFFQVFFLFCLVAF
jgi:DNA-directed RNA polymerase II subunit RPB9